MPIISFTEKDLMRGQVYPPAWYTVEIESIGEKQSKNGESTNYPVEAKIICNADDGTVTYAGAPLEWNFNSKALGFTKGFLMALGENELKVDKRYDLNAATGRKVDVFVSNDLYEGRMVNRVEHKYRATRS